MAIPILLAAEKYDLFETMCGARYYYQLVKSCTESQQYATPNLNSVIQVL